MFIYIALTAHLLADFTFQSGSLAEKKLVQMRYLVIHSIIYAATLLLTLFLFIEPQSAILPGIIIVFSHFLVDLIKATVEKKTDNKAVAFFAFLSDQALHLSIVIAVNFLFHLAEKTNQIYTSCQAYPYFHDIIIYLFTFTIIWDPAAVFIKKLFEYIMRGDTAPEESTSQKAGRIIGKLERAIISLFVLCNQLGAIGLVLAAKSIARYKQLENKDFAEKYLVGTLSSALIALVAASLLKPLL